jgi:Terminase large subunit, T4likevirus-type, N-terminal
MLATQASPASKRPVVAWAPHPGSQALFLACPVFEVLYHGTRGPGKTTALGADFAQHVGQGYGAAWRGILFRRTYGQLDDVVSKLRALYMRVFPGARFNESTYTWRFPDGESLLLRYMDNAEDYWQYHGHEYPWIGWEELTNWSTLDCYDVMKSCCRSSHASLPRKYRATANPWGRGHNVVRQRFIDAAPPGVPITDDLGLQRVHIFGHWTENRTLLAAQPDYPKVLAADSDPNRRKAWLAGSWDVTSGGMFDDLWKLDRHRVPAFEIPKGWRIDRSFDWGSSKPFSIGWWAEADGTEAKLRDGSRWAPPRGTLFRICEFYGWNGKANEGSRALATDIAHQIIQVERTSALLIGRRVEPGPADSSIYDVADGKSIAAEMERSGVKWIPANKGPGSRKNGWELMRARLSASLKAPMEEPGMFIFDTCSQFIRTVPSLPRDDRKTDDVDTDTEDHIADETRYRCLLNPPPVISVTKRAWG